MKQQLKELSDSSKAGIGERTFDSLKSAFCVFQDNVGKVRPEQAEPLKRHWLRR
jgi:hypothetical protein